MMAQIWKLFLLIMTFSVIIGSSKEATSESIKLAKANNELGLNLYKIFAKNYRGNIFFSPLSISTAFGMLFAGAEGNTAKQLRSTLGYDSAKLKSSNVPSAFNQYLDLILPKNQSPNPKYVLNLANELLLAEGFNVYAKYKEQVQDLFHAYIKEVDFKSNSAQIVQDVNKWVKEQTHGKISQILNDLKPSTVMLILNAIYFKGMWKTEFNKTNTAPGKFNNDGLSANAKYVPLMHLTHKFPYYTEDVFQALELPYKGDNISMIILLPNVRSDLTSLENSITPQRIQDIRKLMRAREVVVTFPKFKIEYKRELVSDFKELGATDVFNPGSANLSGITRSGGIYVDQVIHKAFVEVNEEGSEAAAVTVIGIEPLAVEIPPRFDADRPFMFAIMDNRNDMILFLGRVNELQSMD